MDPLLSSIRELEREGSWNATIPTAPKLIEKSYWEHFVDWLPLRDVSIRIIGRLIHWIRGGNQRVGKIGRIFAKCMEEIASKDIAGNGFSFPCEKWMECAERVSKCMREHQAGWIKRLGVKIRDVRIVVKQEELAAKYRREELKRGVEQEHLQTITQRAEEWKKENVHLPSEELSEEESAKLNEVCRYREYAQWFLENEGSLDHLFKWILQNENDVESFLLYPLEVRRMGSLFAKKVRGTLVATPSKLQCPFEGRLVSLRDWSQVVTLTGGMKVTIQKAFEAIQERNIHDEGNIEYFPRGGGFRNFNNRELGPWNAGRNQYDRVDLLQERWWEQLPTQEFYSLKVMQERFDEGLDGTKWMVMVRTSRTDLSGDLRKGGGDVDGTHSWFAVAMPTQEGGYVIINFGGFAWDFPDQNNTLEMFSFLGNSVRGAVAYDQNWSYSMRQLTHYGVVVNADKGPLAFQVVASDILKAWKGEFPFQFFADGCTHKTTNWWQGFLTAAEIDLSTVDFNPFQADVAYPLPRNFFTRNLVMPAHITSGRVHLYAIRMIALSLRPWRGIKPAWSFTDLWDRGLTMHPPRLFFLQQEGRDLPRVKKKPRVESAKKK